MGMGGEGLSVEQLLGLLGLNLPLVLGINAAVEYLKVELQARGLWTDASPWKRWFILAPFAVAIAVCWVSDPVPSGLPGVLSAVKCGAVYAMAAVTLKSLKRTAIAGR